MRTATPAIERVYRAGRRALTRRVRAYVGLGANLGDPAATIAAGVHALAALPGARLRGVSRLYATEPVGVVDQPEFRNAAVAIDVPRGPDPATGALALLVALKGLERAFGRRDRERWGPRELDLDLLVFGRHRIEVERPAEGPVERSVEADGPRRSASARRGAAVRAGAAGRPCAAPRSAGLARDRRVGSSRREAVEGPAAVRPIARWADGAWEPLPAGRQAPR